MLLSIRNLFLLFLLEHLVQGDTKNNSPLLPLGDVLKIFNGIEPNLDFFNLLNRIIVNENDVHYFMHNLDISGAQLENSNLSVINPDSKIKMVIHGWGENSRKAWYKSITEEYLKKGDYSVILVDWEKPSSFDYILSAMNCREVGQIIGRFITKLKEKVPLESIHIIGHSLGAHVAGFAGKEIEKQTGKKIGRITGLDPAGPFFENPLKNPNERLSNTDAEQVDVIHTDGGFFGSMNPLGTIDFYVNGGVRPQPGCATVSLTTPTNLESLVPVVFCSHVKSHLYFIKSINSESYQAFKCDSWKLYEKGNCYMNEKATFGDNVEPEKIGNYFIAITD